MIATGNFHTDQFDYQGIIKLRPSQYAFASLEAHTLKLLKLSTNDSDRARLDPYQYRMISSPISRPLTLPQEPQDLLSPSMLAPHLGQLEWKLTRTVVDCILLVVRILVVRCNVRTEFECVCEVSDSLTVRWRGKVGLI